MRFDPKDADQVLPEGDYEAFVYACEEKTSSNGNEMFEVKWKVYGEDGRTMIVSDYIVSPKMLWKLKKLCKIWGWEERFQEGVISPQDLVGQNALLQLKVREDSYGRKNDVKSYAPLKSPKAFSPEDRATAKADDDECPF